MSGRRLAPAILLVGAAGCSAEAAESPGDDLPSIAVFALDEYVVDGPAELRAGLLSVEVRNDGTENHQLSIVPAADYESLPRRANGSVDVDALGRSNVLVSTKPLFPGFPPATAEVDLAPGTYLFYCDIESFNGDESHVRLGQRLVVTVS